MQEKLLTVGTIPILAEVCEDHATGLLEHFDLAPMTGMAFYTGREATFHTNGMQFAIDLLFITGNAIDSIYHNVVPGNTLPTTTSDLVLELPAGFCKAHNIVTGQEVAEDPAFEEAFGERVPRELRKPFMIALEYFMEGYDLKSIEGALEGEGFAEGQINLVLHALKRFDLFKDLIPETRDEVMREQMGLPVVHRGQEEDLEAADFEHMVTYIMQQFPELKEKEPNNSLQVDLAYYFPVIDKLVSFAHGDKKATYLSLGITISNDRWKDGGGVYTSGKASDNIYALVTEDRMKEVERQTGQETLFEGMSREEYFTARDKLERLQSKIKKAIKVYSREGGGKADVSQYKQILDAFIDKYSHGETWGDIKNVIPIERQPGINAAFDLGIVFNKAQVRRTLDQGFQKMPYNLFKLVSRNNETGEVKAEAGNDFVSGWRYKDLPIVQTLRGEIDTISATALKPWQEVLDHAKYGLREGEQP